jgi:galactose mutarotase-like enzyme
MARLFGREWTRAELRERLGDLAQVAGVERFTYDEGVSGGVRAARVRSGAGLDFTVLFSRGMDIGQAIYKGASLAWVSATGAGHPHSFVPEDRGWLRTFHGGLLTGCGLSNAGASTVDGGEAMGLHGQLSHLPAEECAVWTEWHGDEATFVVEGTVREARVFHENLRLTRKITTTLGGTALRVTDTVRNEGWKTSPLMLLYHLNFGWPVISEETRLVYAPETPAEPRDEEAARGLDVHDRFSTPVPGYAEQCFFLTPERDARGWAEVSLVNPPLGFDVVVRYDRTALPFLTQWKMVGQGEYVCGIEPGNCRVFGRERERAEGRLQHIEPGDVKTFALEIAVRETA